VFEQIVDDRGSAKKKNKVVDLFRVENQQSIQLESKLRTEAWREFLIEILGRCKGFDLSH
jgi:hypothetical protein